MVQVVIINVIIITFNLLVHDVENVIKRNVQKKAHEQNENGKDQVGG